MYFLNRLRPDMAVKVRLGFLTGHQADLMDTDAQKRGAELVNAKLAREKKKTEKMIV